MKLNRRNFLFGSAAAATLAGCATGKMGVRPRKAGEPINVSDCYQTYRAYSAYLRN